MLDFDQKRREMVNRYRRQGYIQTEKMAEAILKVPRELFMDTNYVRYAYVDQPAPIPGNGFQTISAPYMYPIAYEAVKLQEGFRFLEIGAGSGYGAALAYEMVKPNGLVISIEINDITYSFARANLKKADYCEIILIHGDGALGYTEKAPYDAISITAACPEVPPPLLEQLNAPGRLVAPVGSANLLGQDLILIEKDKEGLIKKRSMMRVAYVPLTGRYGEISSI